MRMRRIADKEAMRRTGKTWFATTLASFWLIVAAGACKQTGAATASAPPPGDAGVGSAGPGSASEDDRPDQSVPVAGAYLACLVAKPQEASDSITAGCQVRDKSQNKVDLKKYPGYTWTFVPPKGKDGKPVEGAGKVEVYDLAAQKDKNYYFQVAMRMKIGTNGPAKGAGLTTTEGERKKAAGYFLALKPLMLVVAKKGAGLALDGQGRAPDKKEDGGAGLLDQAAGIGSKLTYGQHTAEVLAGKPRALMPKKIVEQSTQSQNAVLDAVFVPGATSTSDNGAVAIDPSAETVVAQPAQDVTTLVPNSAEVATLEKADTSVTGKPQELDATTWTDSPGGTVTEEPVPETLDSAACDALYEKRNDTDFDQAGFDAKCPSYAPPT